MSITVPIDSIIIHNERQRKFFDDKKIQDLRESILAIGLLSALVVVPDGPSFRLIAGERRLRALRGIPGSYRYNGQDVHPGFAPVVLINQLGHLAEFEAEFEENFRRENLTWQEETAALSRLHNLRRETRPTQTLAETAAEAAEVSGRSISSDRVSTSLILANHLDDPDVAKAKSPKEAIKIIERKAAAEHRQRLAEQFDVESSAHRIIQGDALTELRNLPANAFDVILTDPPYGIDAQAFGSQATTTHEYNDDSDDFNTLIDVIAQESYRVTRGEAHAYVFCDTRKFEQISLAFTLAGWKAWPWPLIWHKPEGSGGMLPWPFGGPRRTYEAIFYAVKGDKRVVINGAPDVIIAKPDETLLHAAQKPVGLLVELLRRSALPGMRILDPFCGSGGVFEAANILKLVATGIEINPLHIATAKLRMKPVEHRDLLEGI